MREILDNKEKENTMTLLNEKQAASMLGLSVFTLQKARRTGGFIPFLKIKSAIRYDKADIDRYIESQKFRTTSEY